MRICPDCHTQVEEHALFCENCGYPLQSVTGPSSSPSPAASPAADISVAAPVGVPIAGDASPGTCSACGYVNVPGETFCQNCGVQLAPVTSAPPPAPVPVPAPAANIPVVSASPPLSDGELCPNCGYSIGPGEKFCQGCGLQVAGLSAQPASPSVLPPGSPSYMAPPPAASPNPPVSDPSLGPSPGWGVPAAAPWAPVNQEYFPPAPSPGRLVVRSTNVSILIPSGKSEIILGRTDPARGVYPDIDLSAHGGDVKGVSRQHARLVLQGYEVYIEDLNATNFTFLNRQKLQPGQRYLLTPGDEIRLGLLALEYLAT